MSTLHSGGSHTAAPQTPAAARTAWGPFLRHYLAMLVSMVVGMVALQPLWTLALGALRAGDRLQDPTLMALVMATDMSLGMGAWMRHRQHTWRSVAEMSAAMYLPFGVLLPAVWTGAMAGGTMLVAGHLLMLPTMLALMLWRREDHAHHEGHPRLPR
jgi:hypothetical protein